MSKKFQLLTLVAIVVLAVAVIGLYFKLASLKKPAQVGQIVSSTIGVGGPPSQFTEISFADGEVTKGSRELKMASGTSTIIFENRSGDDLMITNPIFANPTGSTTMASSYVWVLATTTLNDDLTDESGTAISVTGADQVMTWLTATGTGATSTNAVSLRNNHSGIGPATQVGGAGRARDFPIILQNNNALVLRIYALANVISGTGQGPGTTPATSTNRGFDPILKFDYETVD